MPRRTEGRVVFLSIPSKGAVLPFSAETGVLKPEVYAAMAKLHSRYPDITFVAPMVHYHLLRHLTVDPTWDNWSKRCKRLIERSDELWVLLIEGWSRPDRKPDATVNTSKGVSSELWHANIHGVKVAFVDPTGL